MKKLFVVILVLFICRLSIAEVAVTIYNNNRGLVRDTRELKFPKGTGEIRFTDVATQIIPTSVHFYSDHALVIEQNYDFDLVDSRKLLSKYIDQRIQLNTESDGLSKGTLLSGFGDIVIKEKDKTIRSIAKDKISNIHFPSLPEGLITRPTLVWTVDSPKSRKGLGEVSYLTEGISWTTEYVAVMDSENKSLEFTGWVNIDNQCGTSFKDARLKLIAGAVKIESEYNRYSRRRNYSTGSSGTHPPTGAFKKDFFSDYHLYTLKRKSTILNNQIKQIALFPTATVKEFEREYRVDWSNNNGNVRVSLLFDNTPENGLGLTLPGGKVRIYQESAGGDVEFAGESKIKHRPQDKQIRVMIGYAFDFVCEKKLIDKKILKNGSREEEWVLNISSRRNEAIDLIVPARIWGDWTILKATKGWKKRSAEYIRWDVVLQPDELLKLKYRVLIKK